MGTFVQDRQLLMVRQEGLALRPETAPDAGRWQSGSNVQSKTSTLSPHLRSRPRTQQEEQKRRDTGTAAGLQPKHLKGKTMPCTRQFLHHNDQRGHHDVGKPSGADLQHDIDQHQWLGHPSEMAATAGEWQFGSSREKRLIQKRRDIIRAAGLQAQVLEDETAALDDARHSVVRLVQLRRLLRDVERNERHQSEELHQVSNASAGGPRFGYSTRSISPQRSALEQSFTSAQRSPPFTKDARGFRRHKSASGRIGLGAKSASSKSVVKDGLKDVHHTPALDSLFKACIAGDVILVKTLVGRHDATSLVKSVDSHFRTALHSAARHGHADICGILLARQADMNAREEHGATPLALASMYGHITVLKRLGNNGASPKLQDLLGRIAFHYACWGPSVESVRFLLSISPSSLVEVDYEGRNGLYYAISNSHHEKYQLIEVMLKARCEVNLADKHGRTPLWHAAQAGSMKIAEMLLDFGADPDCLNAEQAIHDATWPPVAETSHKRMPVELAYALGTLSAQQDEIDLLTQQVAAQSIGHNTNFAVLEKHTPKAHITCLRENAPPAQRSSRGVVNRTAFEKALHACMLSEEEVFELCNALAGPDKSFVYRESDHVSLEEEWGKFKVAVEVDVAKLWALAVAEAQHSYWEAAGLAGRVGVVETLHPCPAMSDEWMQTVCVSGADLLQIQFASDCETFDQRSTLEIASVGSSNDITQVFEGHGKKGNKCWRQIVHIPGDTALFRWVTDGGGPISDWGFAALVRSVQDISTPPLHQAKVDALLSGWSRITTMAMAEGYPEAT